MHTPAGNVVVVTTEELSGYQVHCVLGQVLGVATRSLSPYIEGFVSLANGKPIDPEVRLDMLAKSRTEAVERMADAAARLGGNAVLAMRFDHRPVTETRTEMCAYGTAVIAVPLNEGAARVPAHRAEATLTG